MEKEYLMRKLSMTVLLMFILAIFLNLSGCSTASHEAHKHGDMQMGAQGSETTSHEAHKHGGMSKDAQSSETNKQTTCPVLGGEIDKKFYVDHMGKRIYFCCEMCIDKFKEDPEKYMKKL